MRLLEYDNDGEFSLTKDFVSGEIPEYAILSHIWGADIEEFTYKDVIDGTGKNKVGYEKIRFCREQTRRDGLQYFWVDTCYGFVQKRTRTWMLMETSRITPHLT
jgi:hypothetical protein